MKNIDSGSYDIASRISIVKTKVSKHKHKTQGKGNVLRHDHMVFNLKSEFSKPRVRTYELYLNKYKHLTKGQ